MSFPNPFLLFPFFLFCAAVSAAACENCKAAHASPPAPKPSGRVVEYDLTIAERVLSPAGKPVRALTINGGIPGPVLRFREGDFARIRVHNRLPGGESTSIHWHGLLLPNAQDGVPHVTTPPIEAGQTWTFEFPLRQAGTYWYHSHTHLQEQRGVYGAIVIEPRGGELQRADREHVLLLSDWTNESPDEVQRTLLRGDDWYAIRKNNAQSLAGAARAGALKDYFERERTRMAPMDISDVAYDAFLINGQPSSRLPGKPGERARLRVINGSSSTYFYLTFAAGPMTIVAADGIPVRPVTVKRLFMGVAETYDVLVTLPAKEGAASWEFRATAQDGSGRASVFLGEGAPREASDPPPPDLYRMEDMLDAALMDENDPEERAALQTAERPAAPYPLLRALKPTTLPKNLPARVISLRLTGDMERYIWSFNGKTMPEDAVIPIRQGEAVRLEFVNDTMMHHPLHLHGHFFRVINNHGAYSPLKHTVDVPPMGRRVIEFEANEHGDWLFHCHLLYHMMNGMGRVFSYGAAENAAGGAHSQSEGHVVNAGEHAHNPWSLWGDATLQSHMTEGALDLRRGRDDLLLLWEAGWQHTEDDRFEFEADLVYERYVNPNLRLFGGARLTNEDNAENRGVLGARWRLPYMVWSELSIDSEGDARASLAKELRITPRLGVFAALEYDTGSQWEWSAGAEYRLSKPLSAVAQYHSEYGFGGGVRLRF